MTLPPRRSGVRRWLLRLLAVGVIGYGVALAAFGFGQRALIYHPWSERVNAPAGFESIILRVPTGEVTAWYNPAKAGQPTIVFFDGNAGALVGAAKFTRGLAEAGYGLLLVSYPGYDGNPGRPTEESLYATGRAALSWLNGRGVDQPVLLGYSLGSGVATRMAFEHPCRTLILLAPFSSMVRMAERYVPFVPAGILLLDRYDSIGRIGDIHVPLMVVHGDADPVIPRAEGQRLFSAANQPKRFITLPGREHVFDLTPVVPEIISFLTETTP